jgi:hypothetical protein
MFGGDAEGVFSRTLRNFERYELPFYTTSSGPMPGGKMRAKTSALAVDSIERSSIKEEIIVRRIQATCQVSTFLPPKKKEKKHAVSAAPRRKYYPNLSCPGEHKSMVIEYCAKPVANTRRTACAIIILIGPRQFYDTTVHWCSASDPEIKHAKATTPCL